MEIPGGHEKIVGCWRGVKKQWKPTTSQQGGVWLKKLGITLVVIVVGKVQNSINS